MPFITIEKAFRHWGNHLRQKIEPDPGNPGYILTVPGVGYMLVSEPEGKYQSKEMAPALKVVSM